MDAAESVDGDQEARFDHTLKRRRIRMACIPCRNRKARCDGLRPRCSYCNRHRHNCTYRPASQMIQVSQEYLQKLKDRAGTAERTPSQPENAQANASMGASFTSTRHNDAERSIPNGVALSPPSSPTLENNLGTQPPSLEPQSHPPSNAFPNTGVDTEHRSPGQFNYLDRSNSISADGTNNLPPSYSNSFAGPQMPQERQHASDQRSPPKSQKNQNDLGPDNFYGVASTLSFMQTVQTTILSQSSPESLISEHFHSSEVRDPGNTRGTSLFGAETCLPQRSVADDLVDCYFRYVHVLYPFLHEPSFRAEYEQTWVSNKQQDNQWLAMLNVIFALGIHFAYNLEDKSAASDRLFGYAQKLVSFDHFADANLRTLQLLLLSGLYFQSTSRPNQTWNVIGLAIRIATSIGVHLDPNPNEYNVIQRELRRRCWYGCLVLDRVLALNFGRPLAIPDGSEVSLPSNIDDQYITEDGYLPVDPNTKTKIAVFLHSITFSKLMNDVLKALYSPQTRIGGGSSHLHKGSSSTSPEFKDAVGLDRSLVEWFHNLPFYLQAEGSDDTEEFRRVKNILLARFLNLRVLIHRPFAPLWKQSSMSNKPTYLASIDNSLHRICVSVCKSAATQLVQLISRNYYQALSSAWWTDMNYLLTASTVLLVLEFEIQDPAEKIGIKESITEVLDILRHMRTRSSMASSYVAMLEKAQEGLRYVHSIMSKDLAADFQADGTQNMTQLELPATGEIAGTMGVDDFLRTDNGNGNGNGGLPWNMQDLYLMPWEMVVDNPMRTWDP